LEQNDSLIKTEFGRIAVLRTQMRPIAADRVAWSVGQSLSVYHSNEPCKNGCIDRDAVWVDDSGGPKEPCIRWASRSCLGMGNFEGEGRPIVKYRDTQPWAVQNGWADRYVVWVVDSGRPKEECVNYR